MKNRNCSDMDYYCGAKQVILLSIVVQIAPLSSAFGYEKCFLDFENSQYINCIGQGIVNLKNTVLHLPNKTQWLNASQNVIAIVERKTFSHLSNLLELQLNNNRISTIQPGAFQSLKRLRFLDLSTNLIQNLDNWDMSDLTELRILKIGHNKIRTIQSMSLTHLYQLQELDLSSNHINNFTTVAEAVKHLAEISSLNLSSNCMTNLFINPRLITLQSLNILDLTKNSINILDLSDVYMPNLTGLIVTQNNLSAINVSSFSSTPKLALIIFDENPLNISSLLGIQLPELTELHWSSMRPALDDDLSIPCQVFRSLPKLQDLYIMHSNISPSNLSEIGECTNLTSLILSTSSLRKLMEIELQKFRYIKILYLNKCKINRIQKSTWFGLEALHTLILERNQLSFLQDGLFSPLIGLQYLDLSKNYITHFNNKSVTGLRHLKTLILRSCNIAAITSYNFRGLQTLKFLDIRDNSISIIKRKVFCKLYRLETLLLSGNKIHVVQSHSLKELSSLKTLSLANNEMYKLSDAAFSPLKKLINLNISRNQLSFDNCTTKTPFKTLKHLESLDMSYQTQRYKDNVSEVLFQGLESLKKLNVRGISSYLFKDVSFSFLHNLTDFDMSETFQGGDFQSMVELIRKCNQIRYLHLDKNDITNLPENIFYQFNLLENLSLKYNKLKNISKNLLKPLPHLRNLDLFMNPLLCSCENYWFQNWSEFNSQVQIPFLQSYNCFGSVAHINFLSHDLSFCSFDLSFICFIVSFVLTLSFIVASLIIVKLKWSILYFYHIMRVWLQWTIHKENKRCTYDAYISYCSDDEDWVIQELLVHLETQGQHKYKLCFKSRDFIPGSCFIDNIQDAINNSRKTLCIVSRNYLESQWCKAEIEIACSRVFYEKEDVLLVVFLEEIPDFRLSAYHKLRKLIKQNTYINWPEDPEGNEFFWFKLRKALDAGIYEEDAMQLAVTN